MSMRCHHPTELEIQQLTGHRWRLWHFTASHDCLTAQVFLVGDEPRYVSFFICERVEVPMHCELQTPRLLRESAERLVFLDNQIRIECTEVSIADQPVWPKE